MCIRDRYEFEAIGSQGVLRTSGSNGLTHKQFGRLTPETEDITPDFGTANCIRNLIDSIEHDTQTTCGVELASKSQEMIFGFVDSGRQNGRRVFFPLVNRQLCISPSGWWQMEQNDNYLSIITLDQALDKTIDIVKQN